MKRGKFFSCILSVFFLSSTVNAGSFSKADRGTASARALQLPAAARAAAMAGTFTAAAGDASSVFYNPAGMAEISRNEVFLMHGGHLGGIFHDHLAVVLKRGPDTAVGFALQYANGGSVDSRDSAGQSLGTLKPYTMIFSVSYAFVLTPKDSPHPWLDGWTLGLSGKLVESKLSSTARAGAVGAGLLSPPLFGDRIRFGISAENFGGTLTFDTESSPLPSALRGGLTFLPQKDWTIAADAALPSDNPPYLSFGFEKRFGDGLPRGLGVALRGGVETRTLSQLDGSASWTAGVGMKHFGLSFDYAIAPFGGLGTSHRLSTSLRF